MHFAPCYAQNTLSCSNPSFQPLFSFKYTKYSGRSTEVQVLVRQPLWLWFYLVCVFIYSKRNVSIYSYTTRSASPDLSFLFQVEGGRKGEAEVNADIQIQNARTCGIFFFFNVFRGSLLTKFLYFLSLISQLQTSVFDTM